MTSTEHLENEAHGDLAGYVSSEIAAYETKLKPNAGGDMVHATAPIIAAAQIFLEILSEKQKSRAIPANVTLKELETLDRDAYTVLAQVLQAIHKVRAHISNRDIGGNHKGEGYWKAHYRDSRPERYE